MAEVNFSGALPLVQWAWRKMSTQNRKSVLTIIGSTSSVKARSDEAVYVATKHAQAGLARSWECRQMSKNFQSESHYFCRAP